MVTLVKSGKALTVNPLKVSQTVGAAQAFLGLYRSMPLLHGSPGCTAFAKVLFVRHYREPIPLQTTAMDQIAAVMGADDNLVEALKTLCEKQGPDVIGVLTTGLAEAQGSDVRRVLKQFRAAHPQFAATRVIPVATPDFAGSFETGYAAAVEAMIDALVPPGAGVPGRRQRQVNVLAGPALTPGDVEAIKELLEAFDLRPLVLPDLGDALDGHLTDNDFNPLTVGGTPVAEAALMGDSIATLVIGPSLFPAAELLAERTRVPVRRFETLHGLAATDAFVAALADLAGRPVPPRIERQRNQLLDAMVDTHFMTGQVRTAFALEPDLMLAASRFLVEVGADPVAAVVPARGPALEGVPFAEVHIGDLEDLERLAQAGRAELLVGSSHVTRVAGRLHAAHLHLGFPQYDRVGGFQESWVGYRGARQRLFELANLMLHREAHAIAPYRSVYANRPQEQAHGHAAAVAGIGAG